MRTIRLWRFVILFVGLPLTTLAPTISAGSSAHTTAQYLALIVIDAARPDYFQLTDIPNLRATRGTIYERAWVGQLINNTPPSHTTLSTGAFPASHGVVSFSWAEGEPPNRQMVRTTSLEAINAGELTKVIVRSGVDTLSGLIKSQEPQAKIVAISAGKFFAAAAMGLPKADYIIYSARREGTLYPAAIRGYEPKPEILQDPALQMRVTQPGDEDTWAMNVALKIVATEKPKILLLNLPETDHQGHRSGGITAPQLMGRVLANVDRQIGRLMEAYKAAGIYEQTLFVITSDHGMVPNARNIDPALVQAALRRAGARPLSGIGSHIWLADPSKAGAAAEALARANISGIHGAYYKVRDEATPRGYKYLPAPTTRTELDPALDAAYLYLLGTYASAHGPDLALALAENTLFSKEPPNTRGQHESFTWGNQHIPLILAGPGVKSGVVSQHPARPTDVLPTVLTLLGMAAPTAKMDGIVLADALEAATEEQRQAQAKLGQELRAYQDALIARSQADRAPTQPTVNIQVQRDLAD